MHHRHIAQQRGGLVKAGFGRFAHHPALRHHRDACHLRVTQEVPHALLLALADQRSQVQVHGGRAHPQALKGRAQALEQRLVNTFFHQQSRAGRAGLAGVLHDGIDKGRQRRVQVGVRKDDLRAFATQLQRHRAMPLGRHLLDQSAHARAAGEADVVYAGVAGQRVADLMAVTRDDVDCPRRKTGLGGQFGHAQQRQAGVFGRLDHADIAGRQCAAHAAPENLHRVVPRNDVAGHPVRLAPGQYAETVLVGNGFAVQLVAGPSVKLKVACQRMGIGTGLLGRFAAVALLDGRELFGVIGDFS